jgi:hypothetical protein
MKPKPLFNHSPKPFGQTVLEENVCYHILGLLANGTKTAIRLSSFFEGTHHPNLILESQPREKLDFVVAQTFQID